MLKRPLYFRKNVKHISREESARIAALNPGPGIPISMLPPHIQLKLQNGEEVSIDEMKSINALFNKEIFCHHKKL